MKRNVLPIIGSLLGMALILWAINIDGEIINFIDYSSVLITVFGSSCALMISFPIKVLMNIPRILKVLLLVPKEKKYDLVLMFIDLSKKARMDGLLALEDDIIDLKNEFMMSGMQMVIDGVEPDIIKNIMLLKLDSLEKRHRTGQDVFEKWGELAPAFGMLGTLIGLIVMLSKLDDPSSIGPGMATALITTFYGSLMANLVFIPIASNLSVQTDEEISVGEMILDGLLEIQSGSNPRIIEEKLTTYLSAEERKKLDGIKRLKEADIYEQTEI